MPSFAILSRFGVRPAINPRWYAPMFHMPMSSPMMTRMLGFFCADAGGEPANPKTAKHAASANVLPMHLIYVLLFLFLFLLLARGTMGRFLD